MAQKSRIINDSFAGSSLTQNYFAFAQWLVDEINIDNPKEITAQYLIDKNKAFQIWINQKDENWYENEYKPSANDINLINVFLAAVSYYKVIKLSKEGVESNLNSSEIKNNFVNGLSTILSKDEETKLSNLCKDLAKLGESISFYTPEEIHNISVAYSALFEYIANQNKDKKINDTNTLDSLAEPLYLAFENIGRNNIEGFKLGDQFSRLYAKYKQRGIEKNFDNYDEFKKLMSAIGLKFIPCKNKRDGEYIDINCLEKSNDKFNVYDNSRTKYPKMKISMNAHANILKNYTDSFGCKNKYAKQAAIKYIVDSSQKSSADIALDHVAPLYLETSASLIFAKNLGFTEEEIYKSVVLENKPMEQTYLDSKTKTRAKFILNSSGWMHKILPDGTEIYGKINCKFDKNFEIVGIAQQRQADCQFLVKPKGAKKFTEIIVESCTRSNPMDYLANEVSNGSNLMHLGASKKERENGAWSNLVEDFPIDLSEIDHASIIGVGPITSTQVVNRSAEKSIAELSKHDKKISYCYLYAPTFEARTKEIISNLKKGKHMQTIETKFKQEQTRDRKTKAIIDQYKSTNEDLLKQIEELKRQNGRSRK